jgi:hypothetical protein
MAMFGAGEVLSLWERARALHLVDRALLMFAAAEPATPWQQLADAPLGQRDAALLGLRCRCFGARLDALADCPRCGEQLAFTLDLDTLRLPVACTPEVSVSGHGLRLPTSRDLAAVAHEPDPQAAAQQLLARCRLGGDGPLPDADEIDAALAAADPQADLSLALHCEACGHAFDADLDPAALLWQDVERLARRTLQDVDTLARAYGWPEREILALAPQRRAAYVELARA